MATAPTTLSTLSMLRGLLEASRLVRDEQDLARLCDRIAESISASLGFATVAINLYRPAEGDYRVTTVHGNEQAREALLGSTRAPEVWTPFLADRFFRRGAYLIAHDQADWERVPSYVTDLVVSADPEAWHPEDALIVPMRGSDGTLLGVVSVDEPESGVRPSDEEIDVLVAFAEQVAAALESAQSAAAAARDRAALARLLDVSASLVQLDSVESVLEAVACGIEGALGFEKVAVLLVDESGHYTPAGTAGWAPGDPALDISFADRQLDILLVPEFEVEGCYLIECEVANSLVSNGSTYQSQRNGRGARGWNRHWLLVPLVERDGVRRGFIWVDDPSDSLLPSAERLQALRTFANQATVALRAAVDFETLNARNRELAGLHATAVGLLERLDLHSVLHAIVDNARQLAGCENAYLYLADRTDGRLRMRVGLGLFASHVGRDVEPGRGASGRVLVTGETVVVDDYREWSNRLGAYDEVAFRAVAGVPLRADGEVVGVIGIARQEAVSFDRNEIALLDRFARVAELALANASLYAALEQSETLHRRIVESSSDLICLVDLDGRIAMISPSSLAILGREPSELIGMPFSELVHPDDLADAMANFAAAIRGSSSMTVRAQHADGSWRLLEATSASLAGSGGQQQVLATVRDVTERHRLEEQLRQAQKMESIGRLAGGIAHDFNNLLTAIRGYAELLLLDLPEGEGEDEGARESASEIARAAERAAALTSQLLAFSRKQVLRPQLLDLNEVVQGMSTMLARMLGEDVVLTTALETELWPVQADPTQIEQVLLNLAVNARDAMPNGGRLTVRTANLDVEDAPQVALVVADTGLGMDAETAERIFEPLFTTKDVGAGTGRGLATVHGIVAQTGGSIDVASEPGAGTTFTVRLPRAS